jgi:hypothetical protein
LKSAELPNVARVSRSLETPDLDHTFTSRFFLIHFNIVPSILGSPNRSFSFQDTVQNCAFLH